MNLEIRHLRLVAAIADTGGLTHAATRLNLTQSALSHQLADIEARLGVPLYARTGRRLVATPAGERVLAAARRVLAELEHAEADVESVREAGPSGLLRVATECYTTYHWLPPILVDFRRSWPRVEVRLVPNATRRPLQALLAGELEVAIVSHAVRSDAPSHGRLRIRPLFDDELVVVAAPGHPLAARPHVRAADFAREHLLIYNVPDDESTILNEVLRPAGVSPASLSRVEMTEAIVEMAKAGLGIGVLARWAVAPYVEAGVLSATPLTPGGFWRRWVVATRATSRQPAWLDDFATRLAQRPFAGEAAMASGVRRRAVRARARGSA